MKDYNFTLKVSDILRNPSSRDTVHFNNKFSTRIPNLTEEGIQSTLILQGLNKHEVMIECENITCDIMVACDKCGTLFRKSLHAPDTFSKVSMSKKESDNENEEDIFIDPKNETINMEHFLTNTLLLTLPVVNLCAQCEQTNIGHDDENDEGSRIVRKH